MTREPARTVDSRLVAKLIEGCGQGADAVWVDALRTRAAELAAATGGSPVTIEVAVTDRRAFRVGILSDGQVHVPLGSHGPVNFRLQGDSELVARFVLGEGTLLDAQYDGVLVYDSPRPATARLVGRLRRVVAGELRTLLELPAVVAVATRRVTARWRDLASTLPQTAYVTDCAVAVVVALCGAVAGVPAAVAETRVATVVPAHVAAPPNDQPSHPTATTPIQPPRLPAPARFSGPSRTTASERTSMERTEIVATASTPTAGNEHWTVLTVDCEHGTGRVLCSVLQHMPPVDQP